MPNTFLTPCATSVSTKASLGVILGMVVLPEWMCVVLVRQIGTAQGHADAPTFVTRGRCGSQTTRGNSLMRQAGTVERYWPKTLVRNSRVSCAILSAATPACFSSSSYCLMRVSLSLTKATGGFAPRVAPTPPDEVEGVEATGVPSLG